MTHNRVVGCSSLCRGFRRAGSAHGARAPVLHSGQQSGRRATSLEATRSCGSSRSKSSTPSCPRLRTNLRHPRRDQSGGRRRLLLRGASALRAEHLCRLCSGSVAARSGSSRISRRSWRGVLDIDAFDQRSARFVRFCDCFNILPGDLRRCTRLSARGVAGTWRHHSPRCKAPLRVCGGDRAER